MCKNIFFFVKTECLEPPNFNLCLWENVSRSKVAGFWTNYDVTSEGAVYCDSYQYGSSQDDQI
jgi:hypothetical protein